MDSETITLNVKYSGQSYQVNLPNHATVKDFKRHMEMLTNVPAIRQKYMIRGGLRNIDKDTLVVNVFKPDCCVVLLGTPASDIVLRKHKKIHSQLISNEITNTDNNNNNNNNNIDSISHNVNHDVKNDNKINNALDIHNEQSNVPVGLQDLNGTSNINATLQILYRMDDLRNLILNYEPLNSLTEYKNEREFLHHKLIQELKRCFENLNSRKYTTILPMVFINVLRNCYPQLFRANLENGNFEQCNVNLLIDKLFQSFCIIFGETFFSMVSIAYHSEGNVKSGNELLSNVQKIGFTKNNRDILQAIKETLIDENNCKIKRLPKYFNIQISRFPEDENDNSTLKIERKMVFPVELDLQSVLQDDYKEKIIDATNKIKLLKDENPNFDKNDLEKIFPSQAFLFGNRSSLYKLISVISHKGDSSKDGTYIAYVLNEEEKKWYRILNDSVREVDKYTVLKTCGGTENESSLFLCYKGLGT